MEEKNALRRQVRASAAAVSAAARAEASHRIMAELERLPAFAAAETAALFWPMSHEVDTRPLILKWYTRKRILLPVMHDRHLLLYPFMGEDALARHPYGVWEPAGGHPVPLADTDLIVLPGAAFDPQGGRVGWGGGFYDRLLEGAPAALPKIGICFDFQLFDHVPREPHDVPLDGVIAASADAATLYISPESENSE